MAITAVVEAKRDELVQSARELGENLSRRAFGERGADLHVTLADLEQFVRPLVEALASGFLAGSAEEQTGRLAQTLPCPTCGRACSRQEHQRTLMTEHGSFTWPEPTCFCSRCERSFFPSANRAQAGPARV